MLLTFTLAEDMSA